MKREAIRDYIALKMSRGKELTKIEGKRDQ
jgi:hypothetical protein